MMKSVIALAALMSMASAGMAGDSSEKGVPTSPLTIYSGGFAVGALRSLNKELKDERRQFMKVSFVNTVFFKENLGVFFDADWFAPGSSFGADIGFDVQPAGGSFRPFIGAGVGAHYIDKKGKFGDNFGPSGTVHVGFAVELSDYVQMRVRVPYHVVGNEAIDHAIGVDVGFLFSDKFRRVKKLDYNKM